MGGEGLFIIPEQPTLKKISKFDVLKLINLNIAWMLFVQEKICFLYALIKEERFEPTQLLPKKGHILVEHKCAECNLNKSLTPELCNAINQFLNQESRRSVNKHAYTFPQSQEGTLCIHKQTSVCVYC